MRKSTTILWLGLFLWAEPASAEKPKVYDLTVSQQEGVNPPLTKKAVKTILQDASKALVSQGCNVKFRLKGGIGTFKSAPATIENESDLEAAHNVPADVKIVQKIHFCVGKHDDEGYVGCSWRPEGRTKTVIVTRLAGGSSRRPLVWAHEFGHTTGLQHRADSKNLALMTPCGINTFNEIVTKDECQCFLGGPGSCHVPESESQACPTGSQSN